MKPFVIYFVYIINVSTYLWHGELFKGRELIEKYVSSLEKIKENNRKTSKINIFI
uniref:Uncharacterized protein n=1 Tax=Meloidogyne enterolobii TaxID=390850 RepID=A0A6V7UVW3_MELEN|nr:unnamed protein product [Meloidogyne enterolobii]